MEARRQVDAGEPPPIQSLRQAVRATALAALPGARLETAKHAAFELDFEWVAAVMRTSL